jgi:tetratricopeptide (TPR) repeat protein
MRASWCVFFLTASMAVLPSRAPAQHDHDHAHAAPEKLGRVQFAASCKAELQQDFTRGVALLHSFAYKEAEKAFDDLASRDPSCGMAQWGLAMSQFHQIWGPSTETEFAIGQAAARKASALGAPTERERGYIAAIAAFYEGDGIPHASRVAAYQKAMAGVAERNPDDHEAAIFDALGILAVAYNSPPDKSYALQKRAAEILNRMLPLEPEHPGIAHYMIHSFDYPELAELALPAARAYAKIAPSAPHALHMPSHIFTRMGMWRESIESNIASEKEARAEVSRTNPGATAYDGLHAMDYLEYAYLQIGQDSKAGEIAEAVSKVTTLDAPVFQAGYALAAVPARYALERRAWAEAAALSPRPESFPWKKYPYAEAIVHFARAVGGARSGNLETARGALERLAAIQAELKGQRGFDWATQVEIQRLSAAAWLARAEKKDDEAVALLRQAADLEDSTDKHPVTPGSILPPREQLADLLVELGKPADALAEYERSLRSAPARFRTYFGAAGAAERAGQREKAKDYLSKLVAQCSGSEPARAELAEARTRASAK